MSRPAEVCLRDGETTLQNYIAGSWQAPAVELTRTVCDSNTGEPLFKQLGSTPQQIDAAITAADQAHRDATWRNLTGEQRAAKLNAIAAALEEIVDDMAEVDARLTGVPITHTRTIGRVCGAAFRAAAELAAEATQVRSETNFVVERLPLGPAAIVGPWNAPSGIACHKLASALAAGCPVVFKPSEWAPLSGQLIAAAISQLGLPTGVFQLLHGDGMTGAAIVGDPRIAAVSFTGGLQAGRAVAAACANQIKPAQLELGGNNPLIVLPGADLDAVVDGIMTSLTTLNGQWCRALGRLIVHESMLDEVLDATLHKLAQLNAGSSLDSATQLGPLVHEQHRAHVVDAIDAYRKMGGEVLQSTRLPDLDGWFVAPALVKGIAPQDALEEVFGPVATVHSYTNINDAVTLANQAPFGLAAYVFGPREQAYTVARQLDTGMAKVNSVTLFSPHPSAPRPAWKLSGLGEEGTRETFEFFRGSRVIGVPQGVPD
ncbi:MAG: aldehyde dehydrogenase family protein [Gammaproteobacteria bacterium]|nr:aldehyde dehydrogenase family protein [Gammaproteobacteria bacterium]